MDNTVMQPGANGGQLLVGNPGNKGGTGKPKSEVRERCVGSFDERIPILEQIANDVNANPADRLKAIDLLGKYGGLQQVDQTSGDKPLPTPVDFGSMSLEEKKDWLKNLPK